MILLWGLPEDPPLRAVHDALRSKGYEPAFLNQRHVKQCEFRSEFSHGRYSGLLSAPGVKLALEDISAIYLRPHNFLNLPDFQEGRASPGEIAQATRFEQAMIAFCDNSDGFIVNRPVSMISNTSKPYQSLIIEQSGFLVPKTILTTDPAAAREFVSRHGRAIYKSISSERSIVSQVSQDDLDRLDEVENCPTQFQAFVEGVDVRVHVIGGRVIAHRLRSPADDYRFDRSTQIEPWILPHDVADHCIALSRQLGLHLAGIDLRLTPARTWVCFEVNPSPGFTYFDGMSDDIATATADLLVGASRLG